MSPRRTRATLPKMTNSERGKYYRQKHREYEDNLQCSLEELRRLICDLHALLESYRTGNTSPSIVTLVSDYIARRRVAGSDTAPSKSNGPLDVSMRDYVLRTCQRSAAETQSRPHHWEDFVQDYNFISFRCVSLSICGSRDCPIIQTKGVLLVEVTQQTIEKRFAHVCHRRDLTGRLVGKQIKYSLRSHLYFSDDGGLLHNVVEADLVQGLFEVLGNFDDVATVLSAPPKSYKPPLSQLKEEDQVTVSSPMEIDFILS